MMGGLPQTVWLFLAGGLLGSGHCIGMCGGFAATLGAQTVPMRSIVARQLAYGCGRVFTYAFLGAVGGAAGLYLSRFRLPLFATQQLFAVLAGVVMILVAAPVLGLPAIRWNPLGRFALSLGPVFARFYHMRSRTGYFLAGIANGFLPCGLVYAFLAKAIADHDVLAGWVSMAAFGIGTLPAMTAVGCGTRVMSHAVRAKVYRVAAVLVLALGVVTIGRAFAVSPDAPCCAEHVHASSP
jgi:hypothetical protein